MWRTVCSEHLSAAILSFLTVITVCLTGCGPSHNADAHLDWRLVPIDFTEQVAGTAWGLSSMDAASGWKEITFELAVENHSPAWAEIKLYPLWDSAKIITREGWEYPVSDYCDVSMQVTLGGFDIYIPPGFRLPLRGGGHTVCRVAQGSSRYRLVIEYWICSGLMCSEKKNRLDEGVFEVELEQVMERATYPLISLGGWDEYVTNPPRGVTALRAGEVLEMEFGTITLEQVRISPELGIVDYEVIMTISNSSPSHGLWLGPDGRFYTTWPDTRGILGAVQEEIGPGQTRTVAIDTATHSYERLRSGELPQLACVAIEGFRYAQGWSGERQYAQQPIVACFP